MSEQPVEELIGWRLTGTVGEELANWWTGGQGPADYRLRAEVDDLAAWLQAQGPFVSIAWFESCGGWTVDLDDAMGHSWRHGRLVFDQPFVGPTIRDALVAAVRKVAAS